MNAYCGTEIPKNPPSPWWWNGLITIYLWNNKIDRWNGDGLNKYLNQLGFTPIQLGFIPILNKFLNQLGFTPILISASRFHYYHWASKTYLFLFWMNHLPPVWWSTPRFMFAKWVRVSVCYNVEELSILVMSYLYFLYITQA